MKEGWEYKKLGEVANFISGYTPTKEEISNQGKYPYFKVAEMNIAGNELFMRNTSLFVNSPKRIYPKGSIIFPKNGGAIYTEKKRILEVDSVIDLNTEAIFPTAQVELMYLFFLLTFTKISSFDKGGGLPSLDIKKMSESIIPVPPLSEQQSIVDYLDSAFAKIDAMKANAEKALNEAKALFQASLKEMLEPKEGWEEKRLEEVSEIQSGFAFKSTLFPKKGKYQVIRMGNVRPGLIRYNESPVFIESMDDNTIEKALLKVGDMIITQTGSRNKRDYGFTVLIDKENLLLNQRIARIRVINTITNKYLLYYSWTDYFRDQYFANEGGTVGQGNVGIDAIRDAIIHYPIISEQQSIVETLDSLKSKVDRLQANFDKISQECGALKQAILRQVFE